MECVRSGRGKARRQRVRRALLARELARLRRARAQRQLKMKMTMRMPTRLRNLRPSSRERLGPVLFLKGKIVSSDCSKPPEATVTILSGMTTYKMHAADYKSLPVIGEDQFSCEWTNRLVSVNYRAVGKSAGELVSLELR
jgi:hypothetical protein